VDDVDAVLVGKFAMDMGWDGSDILSSISSLCTPSKLPLMTARLLDVSSSTNRTLHDAINKHVSMSSNL
jgi:hypothetical protein